MDEQQPITITQVFARAKAEILDANDETQEDKQLRAKMRRTVLNSLELAELRVRNMFNTRNGMAQ